MATSLGVRSFNPIWAMFDLTGKIFDDTYYMFVLQNTIPYIPTPVYNDPNLSVPLTDPVRFLANGTLPVDVYWDPTKVYRLEFRQNNGLVAPSQDDPLIYEVNNYIPGSGGSTPITNNSFATGNQITNPQFSLINFISPYTLSATDPSPIEIAPGWFLELAGTGTVTLELTALNNANSNPSNAPYALRITNTGWTTGSIFLRQRFEQNGMLWANKTVSSAITARTNISNQALTANLIDSNGNPLGQVLNAPIVTGTYIDYTGHATLGPTINTGLPPAAYIDYKLSLPNNSDVYVTSIQLIVQNALDLTEPAFEQDSINRQIDHTFNYYKDPLLFKPIPSLLTAWDFPLNPAQSLGDAVTMSPTAGYVWDQTIGQSVVGNVSVVRNAVTGGFQATTANANEAFYIQQYLENAQAQEILGNTLSVNINAFRSQTGGAVTCKVYLFRGSSAAVFPNLTTAGSIGGATPLAADGTFTKNNTVAQGLNWTLIARSTLDTANGILPIVNTGTYSTLNNAQDLNFSGWEVTNSTEIADTNKFAIVVTFSCPTSATVVTIDSIGLMKGSVATRPAPLTLNQVLSQCQYYYRKSFLPGVVPTANAGIQTGETINIQVSPASTANALGPIERFDTPMRASPFLTPYNPGAAGAEIRNITSGSDWSNTATFNIDAQGFVLKGTTPGGTTAGLSACAIHWTANARLGEF